MFSCGAATVTDIHQIALQQVRLPRACTDSSSEAGYFVIAPL